MAGKISPPDGWVAPSGFCECGCGEMTKICRNSKPERGLYNGYPYRYVHGHNYRGKQRPGYKYRTVNSQGYVIVWIPGHRLADKHGYVLEHRLVWEENNGRELAPDEHVHHKDGDRTNNTPANLVAVRKSLHHQHHSSSDQHKSALSARLRDQWKDPAYRAKMSAAGRRGGRNKKPHDSSVL